MATRTTVTGYLLDRLASLGVRHLFGVPGDYNLQLLDEVVAHPDIAWVGTANELGAAYAADGYARMRGIGALLTTSGVGELSALNGVAGSYAELLPVVHITGSPKSAFERAGAAVHHTAADGDYERFARAQESVSCALATLTPDNAAAEIDRVLLAALRHRRPVYLRIPADVATAPIDAAVSELPLESVELPVDEEALQGFLRHAQSLLGKSRTAVVLADHLVDRYGAQHELDLLLAESNLPYADLAMAKGLVDESDPRFVGTYFGAFSRPATQRAVETADVLIQAGVRFTDTTSGFFSQDLDSTRVIDLQPGSAKVGSALYAGVPLKAALAGLAKLFVDLPRFEGRPESVTADGPAQLSTVERSAGVRADLPLTQGELWSHLTTFLRGDHFVVADQGTAFFGMSAQPLPAGAGFIGQPLWGSIGYALPALLGAQLADDRRRGILLTGDGAAQMTVQELGSMVRYGVSPIVVLINNQGYTIERAINGPRAAYNDIAPWNWHAVAGAMTDDQALLLTARTAEELDEALARADATPDRLVFLEVHTDLDDIPPLLARIAAAAGARDTTAA